MSRNVLRLVIAFVALAANLGCYLCVDLVAQAQENGIMPTFGDEVDFLRQHGNIIVLSDEAGDAQVAVSPLYQGRVMTSTVSGPEGPSFGWTHHELIASSQRQPHINAFGGEDRFWLGPEGGQFSIFFPLGATFDLEHWQTPEAIDWGAWDVIEQDNTSVSFRKPMEVANYSGTEFKLLVDREVRLLTGDEIAEVIGGELPEGVKSVGFQSDNKVTNRGEKPWEKETGLLSIWILGMFHPSASTTVIVPFQTNAAGGTGPIVNDAYFGKVPEARLKQWVRPQQGALFFRADGRHRSKIGLSPQRAKDVLGSYDEAAGVLTIVSFTMPAGELDYVNSMWEVQENPYGGDVVNSYSDGPAGPEGKPLGPFYELETSSPALALAPGESASHIHKTIHLVGSEEQLNTICQRVLGVSLAEVAGAF